MVDEKKDEAGGENTLLSQGLTDAELLIRSVSAKIPTEERRKNALTLYKYLSKNKADALPKLYLFDHTLKFIYDLVESKDEETIQYLAACLFVSFKEDGNWSMLKETNALGCVKSLLELPGTESRAHAVTTVALVSEGPERHASIIAAGLVEPLVNLLLKSRSDRVLGQISLILSNLAAVDPTNRKTIAVSGAVPALVRVVSVRLADHAILSRVVHALANIAVCPDSHPIIAGDDIMPTIISMIQTIKFSDVRQTMLSILEMLSGGTMAVRLMLGNRGTLDVVNDYALDEDLKVCVSAVNFFVNMAVCPENAQKMVQGRQFDTLLKLAGHTNSGVRLNVAIAFGNLGSHSSVTTQLCTEGVLDCLVEMMNRPNDVRLNQEAVHSLMNITIRSRKHPDLMLLAIKKENYLMFLFETVKNPSNPPALKVLGLQAILALASYPPCRDVMCQIEPLKLSTRKHALSGLDLLVSTLESPVAAEKTLALQIIAMITASGSDSAILDRVAEKPTAKIICSFAKNHPDYKLYVVSILGSMLAFQPLHKTLLEHNVVGLLLDLTNGKIPPAPSGFADVEGEAAVEGEVVDVKKLERELVQKRFACVAMHNLAMNPDSHTDIVVAKAHDTLNVVCMKNFDDLEIVQAVVLFFTAIAKSPDARTKLNANRDLLSMVDSVGSSGNFPDDYTRLVRVLAGKNAVPSLDEDEELDIVERKKRSEAVDTSAVVQECPIILPLVGPDDLPQALVGTMRSPNGRMASVKTLPPLKGASSRLNVAMADITLQTRIGVGSFGEVFDGLYRGERVAIKRIWQKKMAGPGKDEELEYFKQEVEVMQKLNHEGVIAFKGACTTPPDLMIITEFCEKGSIADLIEENLEEMEKHGESAAMPWKTRLQLMCDAASAMAYMHSFDPPFLHRDLKPENLLVTRKADGQLVCKVADFGLARIKDSCQTMTRCGTPCYMAPEVLRGERYGQEADVYSLGVILWEMSTLQQPFNDLHPLVAARKVALEGLRPPMPKNCPVVGYLDLIQKCFQTKPHDRPSMQYIAKKLTDFSKLEL